MKKIKLLLWCSSLLFAVTFLSTSCSSNKTGCPINENAGANTDRKGKLSTKRGKSNLFPKKMRRKKKKSRG